MVKELVALHEGTIEVESEVGSGSCFTVSLPIERRQSQGDGFRSNGSPLAVSVERSPTRDLRQAEAPAADAALILLVDDNPDIRAYLASHLAAQYHVRGAAGGAGGLALARDLRPALIISDVMMPGMSGEEMCRELRAVEELADVPVILLTARAGGTAVAAGLHSGADAYVEKPFHMEALLARIARLIASRESLKASYARRMVIDGLDVEIDSSDAALLQQMFEVVEARIEESTFGVEDLAVELGLSPRHLRRRIKEATGQSPADVLRRYRLERAARLLAAGAAGVSEVGYRVGYGSPAAFSAQFKKHFGVCPSEYALRADDSRASTGSRDRRVAPRG
jgi:DNA-binding response OmpR family regulator